MPGDFLVQKADGSYEPFKPEKLMSSLLKADAKEEEALVIVERVTSEIRSGTTTDEIYKKAFSWLSKMRKGPAARYSLRRALSELGPTGFPFEKFMSEILSHQGFKTQVGVSIMGKCVMHEVDIIGYGNGRFVVCEAKFHNQFQIKSDLKVALYVHSRFKDLESNNFGGHNKEGYSPEAWIVTNTKFTHNALTYGKCSGLHLVGWDYPKKGNLQELIETAHLEPVTTLSTLSTDDKNKLLDDGVVLCKEIKREEGVLGRAGIPRNKHNDILEEVSQICPL